MIVYSLIKASIKQNKAINLGKTYILDIWYSFNMKGIQILSFLLLLTQFYAIQGDMKKSIGVGINGHILICYNLMDVPRCPGIFLNIYRIDSIRPSSY